MAGNNGIVEVNLDSEKEYVSQKWLLLLLKRECTNHFLVVFVLDSIAND